MQAVDRGVAPERAADADQPAERLLEYAVETLVRSTGLQRPTRRGGVESRSFTYSRGRVVEETSARNVNVTGVGFG